jgi:hypothetical protein
LPPPAHSSRWRGARLDRRRCPQVFGVPVVAALCRAWLGWPGDEEAAPWRWGGAVTRAASARPRSGSRRARPGRGCTTSDRRGGSGEVGRTAACLLQRGDRSFTSPRARPGQKGLVCSCCCVRSVTAIGGGGRALPRVRCSAVPCSRMPFFVPVGLITSVSVRRRW